MFSFVNFNSLLKLIYVVSKCSGFIFISISLVTSKWRLNFHSWNYAIFIVSFGFSLMTTSNNDYFPIADFTHSQLLETGVNSVSRAIIIGILVVKTGNVLQRDLFFQIISNLQKCHEEVEQVEYWQKF